MTRRGYPRVRSDFQEVLDQLSPLQRDHVWNMSRKLARDYERKHLARMGQKIAKIPTAGRSAEAVREEILRVIETVAKTGKLRDPNTRQTKLASGEEWTVAKATVDGRVRRADYNRYMKSPEWFAKREEWWASAGKPSTCAGCGKHWSLHQGHLHHRSYERLGYEIRSDLVQLCERCHAIVHANVKRWEDMEWMTGKIINQLQAARRKNGF